MSHRARSFSFVPVALALGLGAACCVSAGAAPELKAGDPAPPFALPGSDGKRHGLAEHAGKRAVVLAWFPKAFTGG